MIMPSSERVVASGAIRLTSRRIVKLSGSMIPIAVLMCCWASSRRIARVSRLPTPRPCQASSTQTANSAMPAATGAAEASPNTLP